MDLNFREEHMFHFIKRIFFFANCPKYPHCKVKLPDNLRWIVKVEFLVNLIFAGNLQIGGTHAIFK